MEGESPILIIICNGILYLFSFFLTLNKFHYVIVDFKRKKAVRICSWNSCSKEIRKIPRKTAEMASNLR